MDKDDERVAKEVDGERIPLVIELNQGAKAVVDEDKRQLLSLAQAIFQREVFLWGDFPIAVPKSRFAKRDKLDVSSLFVAPNDSELDAISRGEDGKLKKLSEEQLRSIRETGRFRVPSKSFPGQSHVWELSHLLQKGKINNQSDFQDFMSVSLEQLIVQIPNRMFASEHPISFYNAGRQVKNSVVDLFDVLLGARAMMSRFSDFEIDKEIEKKWIAFLLSDLKPIPLDRLPSEYKTSLKFSDAEAVGDSKGKEKDKDKAKKKEKPYEDKVFETGEGLWVDLRLSFALRDKWAKVENVREELAMAHAFKKAEAEWDSMKIDWMAAQSKRIKLELMGDNFLTLPVDQKAKVDAAVANALQDVIVRKRNELWLQALEVEELLTPYNALIVNRIRALTIVRQLEMDVAAINEAERDKIDAAVSKEFPIRSRIAVWKSRRVEERFFAYQADRAKTFNMEAEVIKLFQEAGLKQEAYILRRWTEFAKEREETRKSLEEEQVPRKEFTHSRDIWLPQNWRIIEHKKTAKQPLFYTLETADITTISSRFPGWRLGNFALRTLSVWNNGIGWFIFDNQWRGPLGVRALFTPTEFYPYYYLDDKTGKLTVNTYAKLYGYPALIKEIWAGIARSREEFEKRPDTGLLGKSISRIFHLIYNYGIKGVLGTTIVAVGFPALVALNFVVSLAALLTSFIWAPAIATLDYGFTTIIFDRDTPRDVSPWFPLAQSLLKFGIGGLAQGVAALSGVVAVHPIAAMSVAAFGYLKTSLRSLYDGFMYYAIVKRAARVPASDSFLAKRVAGPGMASTFYYQIDPDLALILLEVHLEEVEQQAYRAAVETKVKESENSFRRVHSELFSRFGGEVDGNHHILQKIRGRQNAIRDRLEKEFKKVNENRPIQIGYDFPRHLIRQKGRNLADTVQRAIVLVKQFYQKLWSWNKEDKTAFWTKRNLAADSWFELTKYHLTIVFSAEFMVPLEDADTTFTMQVDHVGLSEYTSGLFSASTRDELELVAAAPSYYQPTKAASVYSLSTAAFAESRYLDSAVKPLFTTLPPPPKKDLDE